MDGYRYDDDYRRPRWPLIGAAVLAAVVLLVVGFGFGRVSAPSSSSRPAQGAASATRAQAGSGPTRTVNGVPVGYAHTQAGAVAAATNFLMVLDGPLVTQPDRYRSAIDTLAAPEARTSLQQHAEANAAALHNLTSYALQGRTVVRRGVPLAYKVTTYSANRSQVSIWAEGLIAVDGALPFREIWSTTSVTVEWKGADWRMSGISAATADSYGPAPTTTQVAVQSTTLPPQLAGYRSYRADVGE